MLNGLLLDIAVVEGEFTLPVEIQSTETDFDTTCKMRINPFSVLLSLHCFRVLMMLGIYMGEDAPYPFATIARPT